MDTFGLQFLSKFFGDDLRLAATSTHRRRLRRGYVTGRRALERPDLNKMQLREIVVTDLVHDTSGVRRAVRRGSRKA